MISSHLTFLFKANIKKSRNLSDTQRVNIACLQEVGNIRDNVLYSELLPNKVSYMIYEMCTENADW